MEFSDKYLNKMLNSAVSFYNLKVDDKLNKIPDKLENVDEGIQYFLKGLKYEAHIGINEPTLTDDPILHTVDLNSKNPGIISGIDNDKNLIIYTKKDSLDEKKKKKKKKIKTNEELEAMAIKAFEKYQLREKQLDLKIEEKKIRKEKDENHRKDKKDLIEIKKSLKSEEKEIKKEIKENQKLESFKNKILKKKNKNDEDYYNLNEINAKLDKQKEMMNKLQYERDENDTKKNEIINKIDEFKKIKQLEREERKLQREKRKKEKLEKQNKNDEKDLLLKNADETVLDKKIEKKEKKKTKISDELMNELFELAEYYDEKEHSENNEHSIKKNVEEQIKMYPSPVPFSRHISALNECDPNPLLLRSLLYGENNIGNNFLKIFHGPPGTGKTWRLMKEMQELSKRYTRENFFICAPSNVGVINLYNRAKSFGINGTIIISKNKCPQGFQMPEEQGSLRFVFSTISMRYSRHLRELNFDNILIDEAAQCQEALVWGLLKKRVKRLYMSGDPYQLPAHVSEEGKKLNFGRSLMERLLDIGYKSEFLDVQRRMHPKIVEFPNRYFYNQKLKTQYKNLDLDVNVEPFKIINSEGIEEKINNSYKNDKECMIVIQEVNKLKQIFNDVVVISPYKAQCILIKSKDKSIIVHTVDSFQGKEADAIVMCTVRNGKNLGFWNDYRRLNVAMTRAKHVFVIVGNVNTWVNSETPLKPLGIEYYNK